MPKIPTALAKKLIKNYSEQKVGKVLSKSDTRGVWFSKEDIMEVLTTPVQGVLPSGLRFYFASYESFAPGRPPKYQEDSNKITIVIVATTTKLDDSGRIIQHPYRKGENLHFDLLETPDAVAEYVMDFAEHNDGQICPPPPLTIIDP